MEGIMEEETTKAAATGSNGDDQEDKNDDDCVEVDKGKNREESGDDTDDSEDTSEIQSAVAALRKERKRKYRLDRDAILGEIRVVDDGAGTKAGCCDEDTPKVKKRNLQHEQIVVGPSDEGWRSQDVTRWKNIVMTPKVKEVVEKDLKTWSPSFTFMVSYEGYIPQRIHRTFSLLLCWLNNYIYCR
jgi:hypothetical protein